MITIDEFKRIEMVVGEVKNAERVLGTEKLLKLEVDIGTETRNMVAGIAQEYSAEELIGKKIIVLKNLQPATIRGIESNGMLLAADVKGKAVLPFFTQNVPNGAKVR
ncbi:MAG: methionine--tRNA ligase subunit beta [Acidobacteriota bacterium]